MASKWTDRQRYVVSVLFLAGYSHSEIGTLMFRYGLGPRMTRQTVAGIIQRTPFRAGLSRPEKQEWLDRLKGHRIDGGILQEHVFRA